jgi:hypothetical protein
MSHALKIETYGPGMGLYVGCISKQQLTTLEKACPSLLGIYRKKALERLWYHNPETMRSIFGVQSWRELCLPKHQYYGPLLSSKDELGNFLDNMDIWVDDQIVKINTRRIKRQFSPAPALPVLKMNQVAVCHGEYFTGHTLFSANMVEPFDLKKLKMIFVECGENGYILSRMRYGDQILYPKDKAHAKEELKLQFIARN